MSVLLQSLTRQRPFEFQQGYSVSPTPSSLNSQGARVLWLQPKKKAQWQLLAPDEAPVPLLCPHLRIHIINLPE
ncbi:Uncharacterized protein HZ326_11704 [Fusarium oxysporum f. sp. albedinis]|nr:Uncharacterized protein HZ326_11704 [Fusarium oxysporum f. sp. albedinis]